ncbi:hypothetical protein SAMN05216175_11114 [Neptunomonas qingdaonensis]|uniref:Uncharacterized protein n=1 Tax=Neptunomonas qingdaonensis TaxID=1045558 RepID=A0A1I2TTS0_9GAMM|nr:hypothetical protein SAMN05216175_11114 [Neptunomonas qingdaonensis]
MFMKWFITFSILVGGWFQHRAIEISGKVRLMNELSVRFPNESLTYLNSLIADDVQWIPQELQQCLDAIRQSNPILVNDPR